LYLKDTPPPVSLLRSAGVPMAVATDLNPGSSPIHDIWTCATLACITQGLTIPEAALGITRHAGQALGFSHLGWLGEGSSADCILLRPPPGEPPSIDSVIQHLGAKKVTMVAKNGRIISLAGSLQQGWTQ
jgi:imidazolonepropionase